MRRAMTCVYCEPKSRMIICSFMEIKDRAQIVLTPAWLCERKMFWPRAKSVIKVRHGQPDIAQRLEIFRKDFRLVRASPQLHAHAGRGHRACSVSGKTIQY